MDSRIMSRREWLGTLSVGVGSALLTAAHAQQEPAPAPAAGLPLPRPRYPARLAGGTVIQPERPLEIFAETDVLVVGGGPAGFAAAVSAARAGAKTMLMERYGHLGGLWTGGLVLAVNGTHARADGRKVKVLRGIGDDLLDRLSRLPNAVANYGGDRNNPTTDPEATKFMMNEMVTEAGVNVVFHSWIADVVMSEGAVRGVVFESKSGRQAVLAKVVVDATGDGDVFAAGGAAYEPRRHLIGMVHRVGNTDRAEFKMPGSGEPLPGVRWFILKGVAGNGLDVKELTRFELQHRKAIWNSFQQLRGQPGGDKLYLLQTASQLGVRSTRLLAGVAQLKEEDVQAGRAFPDVIGVGGSHSAQHPAWPIPYGALVPQKLDGVLAAGRCISVEGKVVDDMREIPMCLITGHGAGAAAAVAALSGRPPRAVDIARVQDVLRQQGAFLG